MPKDKQELQQADDVEILDFESSFGVACAQLAYKAVKHGTCKYEPTPEGLALFKERTEQYFDFLRRANIGHEKSICGDIESWCTSLGITRATLSNYHGRSGAWAEYIDYVRECILAMKKEFAFAGKIPPVTAIFDMVNNHGYRNASSFDRERILSGTGTKSTLTFDDLKRIASETKQSETGRNEQDAETD